MAHALTGDDFTWRIVGPTAGDSAVCDRILRALPEWFGIEEAIVNYVEEVATFETFTAVRNDGETIGLLAIKPHFERSAEVHLIAVRKEWHGQGIGKALLHRTESWLREQGRHYLQVKTLSASREDASYAATRGFYLACGFEPLEEFPTLWNPRNPCLLLVKRL